MKISYAITVCDELEEISRLLNFLYQHKRSEDKICVLLDKPKASQQLIDELYYWSSKDIITLKESTFQGNFADWKNELNRICTGDYFFFLDADEIPSEDLIQTLPEILEINPEMDTFLVPRINTVDGITSEHIANWGWNITKLDPVIGEKILDLSNPKDLKEYEFLKEGGFIIEESIYSK